MCEIDLICLDLDGTIVIYDEEPAVLHPGGIALLNLAGELGVRWCINSGRGYAGQLAIIRASVSRGLSHLPDAILAGECLVFHRSGNEYAPLDSWNPRVEAQLSRFHEQVQQVVEPYLHDWAERFQLEEVVIEPFATAFFIGEDGSREYQFGSELEGTTREVPARMVSRNGGWFSVLPEGLGKGSLLSAYQSLRGISPERTLAVGDHMNDLPMLSGAVAHKVACPSNAAPPVREAVCRAGGVVAPLPGPEGTVEILRRFLQPEPATCLK